MFMTSSKDSLTIFNEQVQFFASEGKISSKLNVFYNPKMRSNRDISVLFILKFVKDKLKGLISEKEIHKQIIKVPKILLIDAFCASGVRAARWLKSLDNMISDFYDEFNELKERFRIEIVANDLNVDPKIIKKNLNITLNTLKHAEIFEIRIESLHFDELILKYKNFDYVDIDPFGSPNPFIDLVAKYGKHNAIIAITSTDTGALTGTHPRATFRKYWSKIVRTEMMHEFGLRILIKKMQLHGLSYDKALFPLLAYYKDHYFRIYFQIKKSKSLADEILKLHKYFILDEYHHIISEDQVKCVNMKDLLGPIWFGRLWDKDLIQEMLKLKRYTEISEDSLKLLKQLYDEIDIVGFYDLHYLSKAKLIKKPIKLKHLLNFLNNSKISATRTHFSPYGIKTAMQPKELIKILNMIIQSEIKENE